MQVTRRLGLFLQFALLLGVSAAHADALDDILDRGTLRVGVAEFVPWTMRDADGELVGFEIDVARKIASDMGVEADFKVYDWEQIIPALKDGKIDVIAGGMAITPGRALQVNFSRPLAKSGVALVTNTEKTRNIKTLKQLNEPHIVIVAVSDTLAFDVSQTLFNKANVKLYPTAEAAEAEVLEGRAHAYLTTLVEARFLALQHGDDVDLPIPEPLIASREALAVKKGEQELLNFLNAWVTARETDMWLETTHDYWFETLEWAPDVAE